MGRHSGQGVDVEDHRLAVVVFLDIPQRPLCRITLDGHRPRRRSRVAPTLAPRSPAPVVAETRRAAPRCEVHTVALDRSPAIARAALLRMAARS